MIKLHSLHSHPDQFFPYGFRESLSEDERVQSLWWTGGFSYGERIFLDEVEFDRYLSEFVATELAARGRAGVGRRGRLRSGLGELRRRLSRTQHTGVR